MTTMDLLRETRRRLATLGWQQESFGDTCGPNCLAGAIFCAYQDLGGERQWTEPAAAPFHAVHGALGRRFGDSILRWNDAPGRTVDDVLAALDAIIAAEEPV